MDATPLTLGQEFSGYATQVAYGIKRLETATERLLQLAQGGPAVGTRLNAIDGFAEAFAAQVASPPHPPFPPPQHNFAAPAAHPPLAHAPRTPPARPYPHPPAAAAPH